MILLKNHYGFVLVRWKFNMIIVGRKMFCMWQIYLFIYIIYIRT